jgi:RsiW-degrading membrane proteinase PrsW (M82 family)
MHEEYPSGMRVFGAAAAAAGTAAAPTILLGPLAVIALPVAFVVTVGHVLLFAIPAYYLLRRKLPVDWAQSIIAGFVIGAVPFAIWAWLTSSPYEDTSIGSVLFAAVPGVLGMLGGLTFRAIIGPPPDRISESDTAAIFE